MLMDLQVYPFPQWLTVLIAKLPVNSTVLVLWCFFCGAPFAVFHCLKWEGGVGGKGEIWSNICFFELAFQIPRLHFLRSRATGCKIFWAFMKKKKKVFIFVALRRRTAIFKCSETLSELRGWLRSSPMLGPVGSPSSLCCCLT